MQRLNCFAAIIPPSSLTPLPVSLPDKGHILRRKCGYLDMHIRMYVNTCALSHASHTATQNDSYSYFCNLLCCNTLGLAAQHHCDDVIRNCLEGQEATFPIRWGNELN